MNSSSQIDSYAPYKYDLEKFVVFAPAMKEQPDPTIGCVLTAKSKIPGVSISEFCLFAPKWVTTMNTYRPPVWLSSPIFAIMNF